MFTQEEKQKHSAKLELISTYRNMNRLERKSTMKNKTVPELQYFSELQRHHLKPELTVFTRKSSQTKLNFQECGLGDDYAAAVSVAISHNPYLEALNFKNNRLRESGSLRIIETLRMGRVKEVNLSENQIGVKGVEAIAVLIRENQYLEKLGLEKAVQKKQTLSTIIEAVKTSKSLIELNLARNNISTGEFYSLLTTNTTLKRLDLHWNTIGGETAVGLFNGLSENIYLEELDLSWNSLGSGGSGEICRAICRCFGENERIKHMDLSYNYLSYEECLELSQGIKVNHTILGIHMVGNNCEVDSQGFLHPILSKPKDMEAHTLSRMLSPRSSVKLLLPSNCWLCERWQPCTFRWNFNQVAWNRRLKHFAQEHQDSTEPVFLHMNIDHFQPELMSKGKDGSYTVTRAIPPQGVKFFFTYRGYGQVSFEYPLIHSPEADSIEVTFFNTISKHFSLGFLNTHISNEEKCTVNALFPVIPRPGPWVYQSTSQEPVIYPEWTIENSVFRGYKVDNAELMRKCMEYDWAHSRLNNLIKSETEQMAVKAVLLTIYDQLKEAFRVSCNFDKFSSPKLTLSSLTDLCNLMNLIDNKPFRLSDLDTNIRSSITDPSSQHIAAISRSEFIEIVVRVAIDKYFKTGICNSESKALTKFADLHVKPFLGRFNTNKWRKNRYLNEEIDIIYTNYLEIMQTLFAKFSGKYAKGGEKPWMSVEEFIQCCKFVSLTSKSFTARVYSLCYQLSLMTHKDILTSKRQNQMSFVEFLEAFARVTEWISVENPEEALIKGKWSDEILEDLLESALLEASLCVKAENSPRKAASGVISVVI